MMYRIDFVFVHLDLSDLGDGPLVWENVLVVFRLSALIGVFIVWLGINSNIALIVDYIGCGFSFASNTMLIILIVYRHRTCIIAQMIVFDFSNVGLSRHRVVWMSRIMITKIHLNPLRRHLVDLRTSSLIICRLTILNVHYSVVT